METRPIQATNLTYSVYFDSATPSLRSHDIRPNQTKETVLDSTLSVSHESSSSVRTGILLT